MSDTLTPQERERFALWLERHADGLESFAGALLRVPGAMRGVLADRHEREACACRLVARVLRETESQEVGER